MLKGSIVRGDRCASEESARRMGSVSHRRIKVQDDGDGCGCLAGDLRLAKLAQECGLSVSHFARAFKRSFGSSVHRYLILQRVEAAKALLQHSNHSLSEIALQTGFSDQPAFSRTFGAIVGTTPGRWRHQYRRERSNETAPDCCRWSGWRLRYRSYLRIVDSRALVAIPA
jgi:AraC-like DNA-binding protein